MNARLGRRPAGTCAAQYATVCSRAVATHHERVTRRSFQRIRPSLAAILLLGCLAGGRCAKGFADRRHQRCKAFFELHRNAINDMTRIATKLRLCPSTRVRAESASLQKTATAKPWDAASKTPRLNITPELKVRLGTLALGDTFSTRFLIDQMKRRPCHPHPHLYFLPNEIGFPGTCV